MQINGKRIFFFSLILVFFASSFIFINSSHSQENAKELLIAPQKTSVSKKEVVKRLEAMDAALSQAAPVQLPLEIPDPEVVNSGEEAGQAQVKEAWPEIKTPLVVESEWKSMAGVIVWLASLGLISGLGFLSWRRRRLNTENKLKAELTEQIKRAEIEENLRKAIEQGSKQYKIAAGDTINIELTDVSPEAKSIEIDKVLFVSDGEKTKIGTPYIDGAKVIASFKQTAAEGVVKGVKLYPMHFRRRKDAQRRIGHRQKYLQVTIDEIQA